MGLDYTDVQNIPPHQSCVFSSFHLGDLCLCLLSVEVRFFSPESLWWGLTVEQQPEDRMF